MIQPFKEFKRDFKNFLPARTVSLFKRAEARNTEINHSKFIILKAKDTMRHTRTDGKYKSILERFQKTKDSEKVKLFITGMMSISRLLSDR